MTWTARVSATPPFLCTRVLRRRIAFSGHSKLTVLKPRWIELQKDKGSMSGWSAPCPPKPSENWRSHRRRSAKSLSAEEGGELGIIRRMKIVPPWTRAPANSTKSSPPWLLRWHKPRRPDWSRTPTTTLHLTPGSGTDTSCSSQEVYWDRQDNNTRLEK